MNPDWRTVAVFNIASSPGNERVAMEQVAGAARSYVTTVCLERLKTATAEAVMNAMEHGNKYQAELKVHIELHVSPDALLLEVTDQGKDRVAPKERDPDLDAKLAGLDTPRGWGLFLIRNMVDEVTLTSGPDFHRLELLMNRQAGDCVGGKAARKALSQDGPAAAAPSDGASDPLQTP